MQREDSKNNADPSGQGPARCPICGRPLEADRPTEAGAFCSKRCRRIDLGRWLGGGYTVSRPIEQADLDEV